jgi:hypothetical protein
MPTETRFLVFLHIGNSPSGKTQRIHVRSKQNEVLLGVIYWYSNWRKYCFEAGTAMLFDSACLQDIKDFLDKKNKQHKEESLVK